QSAPITPPLIFSHVNRGAEVSEEGNLGAAPLNVVGVDRPAPALVPAPRPPVPTPAPLAPPRFDDPFNRTQVLLPGLPPAGDEPFAAGPSGQRQGRPATSAGSEAFAGAGHERSAVPPGGDAAAASTSGRSSPSADGRNQSGLGTSELSHLSQAGLEA